MRNKTEKNAGSRRGVVLRLVKTLFSFYPVLLPIAIICIIFDAVISAIPSVFMQNVLAVVEDTFQSGDWSAASGAILGMVGAGGIGYVISRNLQGYEYGTAGLAIFLVFLIAYCIERLFGRVKRML